MFSNQQYDIRKAAINRELNSIIENALQKVPLDYSLVFSLREINFLTVAETAETLSISETNVKVRLNRAKTMLRKEIEKSYTPEDIFEFKQIYCDAIANAVMNKIKVLYK